jgi:hypothetical protein
MLPEKPASAGSFSNANAQMRFLYDAFCLNLFTADEIVATVRALVDDPRQGIRRIVFHLFAYFAEVVEADVELADKICQRIQKNFESMHVAFRRAFSGLDRLRAARWDPIRRLRDDTTSISAVLRRDDVEALRRLSSSPDFDANFRIEASLFEPCFMENHEPTLLMYAAFYGSVQCFRFLRLAGAEMHAVDRRQDSALHHAIAGGCVEIVRMCERDSANFEGSIGLAVRMYQQDLFQWLHETRFPDLEAEAVAANASRTNNIRMVLFALEHNLDPNTFDQYGCSAI